MRHDQAFKNLVIDFPRAALELFAPEEMALLPPSTEIVPLRQEQQVSALGRRHRILDVPLLVKRPDEEREAIVFAVEGESQSRHFSPARLAAYCVDLAMQTGSTRIVPVVVFLDEGPSFDRWSLKTERRTYLDLQWLACPLQGLDPRAWLGSDNVVARLNLVNMAHRPVEKLPLVHAALDGLQTLVDEERLREKYWSYVMEYARLTEGQMEQVIQERRRRRLSYSERFFELWRKAVREEAVEEGRKEGREEGREEGRTQVAAIVHESILGTLKARGLRVRAAESRRLRSIIEPTDLALLVQRAAVVESVDELLSSPAPRRRRG